MQRNIFHAKKHVSKKLNSYFIDTAFPRKEKLHLCPMHKHKLTGDKLDTVVEADSCRNPDDCHRRSNRLSTVAEAELSSTTDLAEPPPEWSEKVKVAGVEKVKVPPKSYKDVEFNL